MREKEVLLQEIHHRVKNNLNIIISLLKLQALHIDEPAILSIFQDCQNRIKSMALIHERLYQTKDFSRVNYKEYITSLVTDLLAVNFHQQARPEIVMDLGDIFLDLDTAIPCGLIVNELVTNALKYAFPDSRTGKITVSLKETDAGRHLLAVKDNGIGLPDGFDLHHAKTLGLQLIQILVKQLHGTLEIDPGSERGTEFRITFGGTGKRVEKIKS